jgi:hypothetical protein
LAQLSDGCLAVLTNVDFVLEVGNLYSLQTLAGGMSQFCQIFDSFAYLVAADSPRLSNTKDLTGANLALPVNDAFMLA